VHPEAAFLAGYALVLVAVGAGLESLGRRSADPWASRALAASRPPEERDGDYEPDWPHSEVPVFHTAISGVALAAAIALTIVSITRHHDPVELIAQGALLVLIVARVCRLITRHRSLVRSQHHPPAGDTFASSGRGNRGGNAH